METWYMNRLVCYKKKFLLFLEDALMLLFQLLVNLANKWRSLFGAGKKTYTNKYHTGMQILFDYAYEYLH